MPQCKKNAHLASRQSQSKVKALNKGNLGKGIIMIESAQFHIKLNQTPKQTYILSNPRNSFLPALIARKFIEPTRW